MKHDKGMLRDYLVADVEDPRINLQSILTRHFLANALFKERFQDLAQAELFFGAGMNWLLAAAKVAGTVESMAEIAHALNVGAGNCEFGSIPHSIQALYHSLPARVGELTIPNYVNECLANIRFNDQTPVLPESVLNTFQQLWIKALEGAQAPLLTVFEPACGSANDYRFLKSFGLAQFLDYTGIDICEKNIVNARELFPDTRFQTGNVFEIAADASAFECVYVHDLLEHFSPDGIDCAVSELCRVTKRSICLHFFNMEENESDVINPIEDYHWNLLSMDRMRERFQSHGFDSQVLNIGVFQQRSLGFETTHNPRAYTFLLRRLNV